MSGDDGYGPGGGGGYGGNNDGNSDYGVGGSGYGGSFDDYGRGGESYGAVGADRGLDDFGRGAAGLDDYRDSAGLGGGAGFDHFGGGAGRGDERGGYDGSRGLDDLDLSRDTYGRSTGLQSGINDIGLGDEYDRQGIGSRGFDDDRGLGSTGFDRDGGLGFDGDRGLPSSGLADDTGLGFDGDRALGSRGLAGDRGLGFDGDRGLSGGLSSTAFDGGQALGSTGLDDNRGLGFDGDTGGFGGGLGEAGLGAYGPGDRSRRNSFSLRGERPSDLGYDRSGYEGQGLGQSRRNSVSFADQALDRGGLDSALGQTGYNDRNFGVGLEKRPGAGGDLDAYFNRASDRSAAALDGQLTRFDDGLHESPLLRGSNDLSRSFDDRATSLTSSDLVSRLGQDRHLGNGGLDIPGAAAAGLGAGGLSRSFDDRGLGGYDHSHDSVREGMLSGGLDGRPHTSFGDRYDSARFDSALGGNRLDGLGGGNLSFNDRFNYADRGLHTPFNDSILSSSAPHAYRDHSFDRGLDNASFAATAGGYDGFYSPATSFAHGRDRDYNSYGDLLSYQNGLARNADLSEAERLERWNARAQFEALNDDARMARWRGMDYDQRSQLGLMGGYYGNLYGGQDGYLRHINTGYGNNYGSYYPLAGGLSSRYSNYLQPGYASHSHHLDDQYLYANDLASYSNSLRYDESLAEAERQRRWRERQQFEMMAEAEQARYWRQLSEQRRMELGLGTAGFAGFRFADPSNFRNVIDPTRLSPMQYGMSDRLQSMYSHFLNRPFVSDYSSLQSRELENALAYYDLVQFENQLRQSQLDERERMRRWRERVAWQELTEAERRPRWWQMREQERAALGLGMQRYFGQRYGRLGRGYGSQVFDPRQGASLRYGLPQALQDRYKPYMGASFRPPPIAGVSAEQRLRTQTAQRRLELANQSIYDLRQAEQRNKAMLERMDRERALANGHVISAKTWRA